MRLWALTLLLQCFSWLAASQAWAQGDRGGDSSAPPKKVAPDDEIGAWLRDNLGESGSQLADFWRDHRLIAQIIVAVAVLALLYGLYKGFSAWVRKISGSDSKIGHWVAALRVPSLLRRERFGEAGEILERLGRQKEAADAYFKGKFWDKAADLYFRLGVKLKAARAYEKIGNFSTAAVTYEELGDYEAAERSFRAMKDLRSVAKMYSKIGQHKKAAALFREMGLDRDEAEALEKANMPEQALALWRDMFSNYDTDASSLTPLALRERNTVAAHIYLNLEKVDEEKAIEFLKGISQPEGIPDVFQKQGEFQKSSELKEIISEFNSEAKLAENTAQSTSHLAGAPAGELPGSTEPEAQATGHDEHQDNNDRPLQEPLRKSQTGRRSGLFQHGPGGPGTPPADARKTGSFRPGPGGVTGGMAGVAGRGTGRFSHGGASPLNAPPDLNIEAQALMDQGDYAAAGDLFEEAGNYMRAIDAYELALSCPPEGFANQPLSAWQRELIERIQWLYERNGSPELAAEFFQRIGLRSEAVDLFLKVGDNGRAAQILEEDGDFEAAAQIYQDLGDRNRSILCLARSRETSGDFAGAGDLYTEIKETNAASEAYEQAYNAGQLNEKQWQERMALLSAPKRTRRATGRLNNSHVLNARQGSQRTGRPRTTGRRPRRTSQFVSGMTLPGAVGSPRPRERRTTRSNPLPRHLQHDVSELHALPGDISSAPTPMLPGEISQEPSPMLPGQVGGQGGGRGPAGPPQGRKSGVFRKPNNGRKTGSFRKNQPGARQTGQFRKPAPGPQNAGPRKRVPTRRLSGAASRVMQQGPGKPPKRSTPPNGQRRRETRHTSSLGRPQRGGGRPPANQGPGGAGAPAGPGRGRQTRRNNPRATGIMPPPRAAVPPPPTRPKRVSNNPVADQAFERGEFQRAGELYERSGDFEFARQCFKEIEDWPKVAEIWRELGEHYAAGVLFFALGKVQDAIRELIRVPDNNPDVMKARRVAAILYGLLGQFNDAKTYFDVSFDDTVDADDVEALYYYAQVLEQDDRTWPEAMDLYNTVLQLQPHYRDTQNRLLDLKRGRPSELSSIYQDAEQDQSSLFYTLQEQVMSR